MKKILSVLIVCVCLFSFSSSAGATPIETIIIDSSTGLEWVADANMNGLMTWAEAMAWADGLVYGDYNDWRLPKSDPYCWGFDCITSEMGHLFYDVFCLTAGQSILVGNVWQAIGFENFQPEIYWSMTPQGALNCSYYFAFQAGWQGDDFNGEPHYALAVRDGPPILTPEPASLLLIGTGLIGLIALGRRKSR